MNLMESTREKGSMLVHILQMHNTMHYKLLNNDVLFVDAAPCFCIELIDDKYLLMNHCFLITRRTLILCSYGLWKAVA